jgi:hypothetical protein
MACLWSTAIPLLHQFNSNAFLLQLRDTLKEERVLSFGDQADLKEETWWEGFGEQGNVHELFYELPAGALLRMRLVRLDMLLDNFFRDTD